MQKQHPNQKHKDVLVPLPPSPARSKKFFDSPRNLFSRTYSASNLRISRTACDTENDLRYSNAIVDDSSSSDNEDDGRDSIVVPRASTATTTTIASTTILNDIKQPSVTTPVPALANIPFDFQNDSDSSYAPNSPVSYPGTTSEDSASSPPTLQSLRLSFFTHMRPTTPTPAPVNLPMPGPILATLKSTSTTRESNQSVGFISESTQVSSSSSSTSSPNIFFKKMISKKNLTPKLKAFKRVATELQNELSPLDSELKHESIITTSLKEEDDQINTNKMVSATAYNLNQDNLKKFEIINRANEAWNHHNLIAATRMPTTPTSNTHHHHHHHSHRKDDPNRNRNSTKSSSVTFTRTRSRSRSNSMNSTASESTTSTIAAGMLMSMPISNLTPTNGTTSGALKRKSIDNDSLDSFSLGGGSGNNCAKRRIVSISSSNPTPVGSPVLGGVMARRGSNIMMQNASDDLEMLSLH
ncbi:unnamed protein product [Ambrosiozyma monospora]|uniref:Unnamed protein product n=1 Tax=Ambrosiozyma monospora TaxID=43982 RepID=A0A9W7DGX9_AMBMO|nr:unnamed protein product [Ambrosiozyma monospora]